jgi:soluble lytic murein transglycosylase
MAKALEKENRKAQAYSTYKKILHDFPGSYYAFRANNKLKNSKQPFKTDKSRFLPENGFSAIFPYDSETKTMGSLNKLAKLGDIQTISDFKIHNNFIQSYIANKGGRHVYSMLLARDEIDKTADKGAVKLPQWQLAYPLYYVGAINKNAHRYGISPYLLIAIIKEESHFDTSAKSDAGARGLMQVMPGTADFVQGEGGHDFEDIDYNIYLGTKYFAQTKKELQGDEMLAVLAYNAGPGAVKKWLEEKKTNDVDEFIENIPYPETRNYVQKVFSTYWNYFRIYAD